MGVEMKKIEFLDAVKCIQKEEVLTIEQRDKNRQERLEELVKYTAENSPYFKKIYASLGENFKLQDIPKTNKKALQPEFDNWVTDSQISKDKIYEFQTNQSEDNNLFLNKYTVITTSGTTGEPMLMVRDSYHNVIHGALMQERLLKGVSPNLLRPIDNKIAAVIATEGTVSSYSSLVRVMKQYPEYAHNICPISIMLPINEIVSKLNKFKPNMLSGYPSMLTVLATEQLNGNLNISPELIACSAETLSKDAYLLLKDAFKCKVINNYCSTEGGEIAMTCECGELHINDDWIIVEAVDENLMEVPDGEISKGVLVTDLTNYAQPIIRYYVDDNVKIIREKCKCGSTFPRIEVLGRVSDTLNICGVNIPSVIFAYLMHDYSEVLSFQFAQISCDTIEFRCVLHKDADIDDFRKRLEKDIDEIYRKNNCKEAKFIFTQKTPKNTGKGGKLKTVLNELE